MQAQPNLIRHFPGQTIKNSSKISGNSFLLGRDLKQVSPEYEGVAIDCNM
jgi:hypothetical protein